MAGSVLWSFGMDLALSVLLLATVGYMMRLNGRLSVLRQEGARLAGLVKGLDQSTRQAEAAVGALKAAAAEAGRALNKLTERADASKAEIEFLLDRAEPIASRLETGIRSGRDPQAAADEPRPAVAERARAPRPEAAAGEAREQRLADLLRQAQALQNQSEASTPAHGPARPEPRMSREQPAPRPGEPRPFNPPAAPRSRSERELERAIGNRR